MSATSIQDLINHRMVVLQRLAVAIDRTPNKRVQESLKEVRLWLEYGCDCKTNPVARALLGFEES